MAMQVKTSHVTCTKLNSCQVSEPGLSDPRAQVFHMRHSVSQSYLGPHANHHPDWNVEVIPVLGQFPLPAQYSARRMMFQRGSPTRQRHTTWTCFKMSFTIETGHFDRHILAGSKVACFPKCLLSHLITKGGEQHLVFFIGPEAFSYVSLAQNDSC